MSVLLGIDYGRARVGVAISDELHLLAHPLETIAAKANVIDRIARIVRDRHVSKIVVGLPKHMSGETGNAAAEVKQFVEKLGSVVQCDVVTWDERLTTMAAHRSLRETGKKTRQTRAYVDQVAAQWILQGYLDRLQASVDPGASS
jgi:putative Holliday junction resolvase